MLKNAPEKTQASQDINLSNHKITNYICILINKTQSRPNGFNMTNRDDFLQTVKTAIANRVGHHCSNPECDRSTSGPSSNGEKAINTGKAAHITAAAPGGARYDATLSTAARRAISNGMWLCGICADMIDKDKKGFPVEILQK